MAMTRRAFLRNASIAGGGLVVGFSLGGCGGSEPSWPQRDPQAFQPNAFLQLFPDGRIVLLIHKAELGQGVITGLATLVAEELEVDPQALDFEFARPHADYVDDAIPMMATGGSTSMRGSFVRLREAAAGVRQMLVTAAAQEWQVAEDQCLARDGHVVLRDGSRRASYGELAETAGSLPVPEIVALRPPAEWRLIGQYDQRLDAPSKVDGSAIYAIDVELPGMLTAVLRRCPHFGGKLLRVDAGRAREIAGVREVLELDAAVAVLAEGYWAAQQGARALTVDWDPGPLANLNSAGIRAGQAKRLDTEAGRVVREDGEAPAASARTIEAEYQVPYLAHACMEPMNAVASVTADRAEIWAGNQAPDSLQKQAADLLDLAHDQVIVHSMMVGGGFGRRAMMDFALEAARLSQAFGVPVKLIWSREDDIQHGHYRPAVTARLSAAIGEDGAIQSWSHRLIAPSIMAQMLPSFGAVLLPGWAPGVVMKGGAAIMRTRDHLSFEGAVDLPYQVPHVRVEYLHWDPGVPVGVWRSVGHSQNAFFTESFADELAAELGEDPLQFRLARLPADSRLRRVLELAAEQAGWGTPPASGRGRGVAAHESFGTAVAEIAEVSVTDGQLRVHRVVCAVDCGTVINPDIVRAQIESAVIYGLSAALYGEITLANGAVEQGNFDDYPVLRIDRCPEIEVHIVPSENPPEGIGEPGLPPLAPAVANAVYAATGQRLRQLPLTLG